MFERAIWDKSFGVDFLNFEIDRIKRNFQKSQRWFVPKIARTKHVITSGTLIADQSMVHLSASPATFKPAIEVFSIIK